MTSRAEVARAIAFFDATEDVALLHTLTRDVAGRVRTQVRKLLETGDEETIPAPAELYPAREPAAPDEAVRTLRSTTDFALLQALAKAIGRRIEAIEIVASADLPEGTRVSVPEKAGYPAAGGQVTGTVVATGTMLDVQLDAGERWQGPPSLARRVGEDVTPGTDPG